MAERRMISKKITESDEFLSLPYDCQSLYLHLMQYADDDGVVDNYKSVMKLCSVSKKTLNILIKKKFLSQIFHKDLIVIKHWNIHNYIPKDRYKKSNYSQYLWEELMLDENKSYTKKKDTDCIQDVNKMETQVSIGKNSIERKRIKRKNIRIQPVQEEYDDSLNIQEDLSVLDNFLKEREYE